MIMNKNYFFLIIFFSLFSQSYAQVTGNVFPCGGGTDTLIINSDCSSIWASDSTGSNVLSTTDTLVFGPIYNDTTIYLVGLNGDMDSSCPLPNNASAFTGNVRGYYFTSPVDMIITGLWVPNDFSTNSQNVEVVIFDNQTPPPLWSSTTNAFQSKGYWNNYPANDTIQTCIKIDSGDVVGIYGQRGSVNGYAPAPYVSMINGTPVTFTRTGMQQSLAAGPMNNIWSENGLDFGRVEFFYDVNPDTASVTPINIIVPQPTTPTTSFETLCGDDSIFVGGAYQDTAGTYRDTLTSVNGCDSVHITTLSISPDYSFLWNNEVICLGDSILLGGAYQKTAGIYIDSLQTVNGCDSNVFTFLDIKSYPVVNIPNHDTLCVQVSPFNINATPVGGVYSGSGVSGTMFDPSSAIMGANSIIYTFTDTVGCTSADTAIFYVQACTSIGETTLQGCQVYPNPVIDVVTVQLPNNTTVGEALMYSSNGALVETIKLSKKTTNIDFVSHKPGVYILEIKNVTGQSARFRLIKK